MSASDSHNLDADFKSLLVKSIFSSFILVLTSGLSFAVDLESHIPTTGIEQFISENLDLATFRNSTGPRRTSTTRTFAALGLSPTLAKDNQLQFNTRDWFYGVEIKGRKDYNGDGVEDLALCFTDKAMKGTYSTSAGLLATRYSENGFLIVLGYQMEACEK